MISSENREMQVILGKILRDMREEAGYTIKDLSELANIERNGYSLIEKGERNVSIGILCKISTALNVTPTDIVNSTDFSEFIKKNVQADVVLTEDMLNEIDMIKFGKFIKKKREISDLPQQKFAEYIGISRNEINRIENNRAKPDEKVIHAICITLEINIKELLNEIT